MFVSIQVFEGDSSVGFVSERFNTQLFLAQSVELFFLR
jgi:hypothetical protein